MGWRCQLQGHQWKGITLYNMGTWPSLPEGTQLLNTNVQAYMRAPTSFVIISKFGRTFSDSNPLELVPGRGDTQVSRTKYLQSSLIDLGDVNDCSCK